MPRNKREQGREEKRDEIVAAARRLFLEEGFEATAMSRLAAAAGVAPNTIYWYFKNKDEVLVAVLDAEFSARMTAYLQHPFQGLAERLLWVANQLEQVSSLVSTVHSRLQSSAPLNAWHDRFHLLSEGMLHEELRQQGIPAERIGPLAKIAVFTVEGLLAHPMTDKEKHDICATLACY